MACATKETCAQPISTISRRLQRGVFNDVVDVDDDNDDVGSPGLKIEDTPEPSPEQADDRASPATSSSERNRESSENDFENFSDIVRFLA